MSYILCHLIEIYTLFTFNAIIGVVEFRSTILLFILFFSFGYHAFDPLILPSFGLIDCFPDFILFPTLGFLVIPLFNYILVFFFKVSIVYSWLIKSYLKLCHTSVHLLLHI